jgi:ribosomal protein S12 methylthiotransferase
MPPRKSLRVALVSLGCPKNLIDSERMLGALAEAGCVVGAPWKQADVIVINTCAFLAAARRESYDVIAEALERKRRGHAKRVVVAGCLSSRDRRRLFQSAEGIDAIVGVNDREKIVQAVTGDERFAAVRSLPRPYGRDSSGDAGRFRLTPRHTAYLRIAEGCSQKCSFCTIPAIRGPYRSKPVELVLAEARELIADGAVELNVIAQDTTAYGMDWRKGDHRGPNLSSLLRELDSLDGVRWIRLMYAYPRRFDGALIETIARCRHVVPYVDLPLQHISTPVLKRMGRRVTRKQTEALLAKLRRRIPRMTIRTSMIVGFPGETDGQFRELLDFVRSFRFDALGVFEFSPEPGTGAAKLSNPVSPEMAAQRAETLMAAQRGIAETVNASLVRRRRRLEVLVDGVDVAGRCVGRHAGQAPDIDGLCFLARPRKPGTFVRGTVVGYDGYDLRVDPDHLRRKGG